MRGFLASFFIVTGLTLAFADFIVFSGFTVGGAQVRPWIPLLPIFAFLVTIGWVGFLQAGEKVSNLVGWGFVLFVALCSALLGAHRAGILGEAAGDAVGEGSTTTGYVQLLICVVFALVAAVGFLKGFSGGRGAHAHAH